MKVRIFTDSYWPELLAEFETDKGIVLVAVDENHRVIFKAGIAAPLEIPKKVEGQA